MTPLSNLSEQDFINITRRTFKAAFYRIHCEKGLEDEVANRTSAENAGKVVESQCVRSAAKAWTSKKGMRFQASVIVTTANCLGTTAALLAHKQDVRKQVIKKWRVEMMYNLTSDMFLTIAMPQLYRHMCESLLDHRLRLSDDLRNPDDLTPPQLFELAVDFGKGRELGTIFAKAVNQRATSRDAWSEYVSARVNLENTENQNLEENEKIADRKQSVKAAERESGRILDAERKAIQMREYKNLRQQLALEEGKKVKRDMAFKAESKKVMASRLAFLKQVTLEFLRMMQFCHSVRLSSNEKTAQILRSEVAELWQPDENELVEHLDSPFGRLLPLEDSVFLCVVQENAREMLVWHEPESNSGSSKSGLSESGPSKSRSSKSRSSKPGLSKPESSKSSYSRPYDSDSEA